MTDKSAETSSYGIDAYKETEKLDCASNNCEVGEFVRDGGLRKLVKDETRKQIDEVVTKQRTQVRNTILSCLGAFIVIIGVILTFWNNTTSNDIRHDQQFEHIEEKYDAEVRHLNEKVHDVAGQVKQMNEKLDKIDNKMDQKFEVVLLEIRK